MKKILSASIFVSVSLLLVLAVVLMSKDVKRQNSAKMANNAQEVAEEQVIEQEDEGIDEEVTPDEEAVSDYILYTSTELGIQFEYPAAWGDIEENIKDVNHVAQLPGSDWRKEATLMVNGYAFLFTHTDGDVMGRGGFWGDRVSAITDATHFKGFCADWEKNSVKSPAGVGTYPDESCELKQNAQGLFYVHMYGDMWDWEDHEDVNLHFFFNPSVEYKRVTVSDIKLSGNVVAGSRGLMHVVQTFKFIQ